ncbi:heat-inducible transcriptional repressor HrcA [Chrysiogenes arsenatis]|uniref:heat-inducible transcriptional repressor HrcA n=1 Tax=Chrysiogenes arsenatis TaxID=309797 RepID=UPI000420E0E9|nr:heat-inducible transcriptional repressor HrcA [Chrysiogenes arsenatis]
MHVFDERSQVILNDIVKLYIESGEPVGSRTLSRSSGLNLSASSIRNIMSDLEYMGFIAQPHTSAGRIPTDAGYRFFVDTLITHRGKSTTEPGMRNEIRLRLEQQAGDKQKLFHEASRLLSSLTSCMAIVSAPRLSSLPVKHISFMALGDRKMLVVLVTAGGMVQNAIVDTQHVITADILERINRFMQEHINGHSLSDARKKLRRLMRQEMEEFRTLLEKVSEHKDICDNQLFMDGFLQMFDGRQAPSGDIAKMRQLFSAFEEKKVVFELIDKCIDASGVKIFIGTENPVESMSDYTVVTQNYGSDPLSPMGAIGVIGPKTMNYHHVIDIIDITASALGAMVRE